MMGEFISKTCHRQLHADISMNASPTMPNEAVASPIKGVFMCVLCNYTGSQKVHVNLNTKNTAMLERNIMRY